MNNGYLTILIGYVLGKEGVKGGVLLPSVTFDYKKETRALNFQSS